MLSNLTGVCYWWGWASTCGLTALPAGAASKIPQGHPARLGKTVGAWKCESSESSPDTSLLFGLGTVLLDWELQPDSAATAKRYSPLAFKTAALSIDAIEARYQS